MEKKLYKKPSVEEVKVDLVTMQTIVSRPVRPPRGTSASTSTLSVEDNDEIYTSPLTETPYK